jgi:hypothetical protein
MSHDLDNLEESARRIVTALDNIEVLLGRIADALELSIPADVQAARAAMHADLRSADE